MVFVSVDHEQLPQSLDSNMTQLQAHNISYSTVASSDITWQSQTECKVLAMAGKQFSILTGIAKAFLLPSHTEKYGFW
jgi:Neuraminidase (sialidase)